MNNVLPSRLWLGRVIVGNLAAYRRFIDDIFGRHNAHRAKTIAIERASLAFCQPTCVQHEQAAIFGRASPVKANQNQFFTLQRVYLARYQIAQGGIKDLGNSFHVSTELSSAFGFPLRDG